MKKKSIMMNILLFLCILNNFNLHTFEPHCLKVCRRLYSQCIQTHVTTVVNRACMIKLNEREH
jgi:hypothetical protein